jgi:hypothetical protein
LWEEGGDNAGEKGGDQAAWGKQGIGYIERGRELLELYLYIIVSLIVRVFPAYFTPVHVLYIVAFGPSGIQVAYF